MFDNGNITDELGLYVHWSEGRDRKTEDEKSPFEKFMKAEEWFNYTEGMTEDLFLRVRKF